jgi:hypothetical protein
MELFLNLCWLALLLPAYALWRQRISSNGSSPAFICTLACVLVLLFPVISASDDLHAIGQAMEESKRTLRHGGHCSCTIHSIDSSRLALLTSTPPKGDFEQAGTVFSFSPHSTGTLFAFSPTGRAPPSRHPISL